MSGTNAEGIEEPVIGLQPLLAWPFALLAAAIVALTLGGIAHVVYHQRQKEFARLQAIVTLKVDQISTWLQEREEDAQLLHGSRYLSDLHRRWRDTGDPESRELLLQRLADYRNARSYQGIFLFDDRGEPALATADMPLGVAPELRATIRRAITQGAVSNTGLYRYRDKGAAVHLDFVVPLPAVEGQPGAAIALRVDPRVAIYPLLQSWPIPSASGEILLFRRDGDQVLYLSDLRQHPDAAAKLRRPIAESRLLAARVLRGEVALGSVVAEFSGIDYRRATSLGVAGAIPGTGWFLLAKMDRAEVYAPVLWDAGWIGLLGALALLAAAVAQIVAHRRQKRNDQRVSWQQIADERHRLRTLIQSIPDLIWLKDPDGVYLACNPAFERFFGAREANIVGKSDYDFVTPDLADFFREKDREAIAADGPNVNEEWITFPENGQRALLQTIKTPMWNTDGELIGVLGIGRDITALREAEAGKRAVQHQYQMLFRSMLDGFALHEMIFDADGEPADYRFLAVNPAFECLTGLKAENLLGKTALEVLPSIEPHWIDIYGRVTLTGEPALFESGSQDLGRHFKVSAFRPAPGQFACVFTDITQRQRVEEALRAALAEKTVLLKEVHHRVKNNLQIVASLLNLQARQVQSPAALAALQDTRDRIRSMALLHETLYREGDLGRVDGAVYLAHLCAHLSAAFGSEAGRVRLRHRLAPIPLTLDQAVPCGLIANELVSNAFKHAFPGERGGEVCVALIAEPDGRLALTVTDDGVGLPPGLAIERSDALGLQLVVGLTRQLGGAIETQSENGAAFRVVFPAFCPNEISPP